MPYTVKEIADGASVLIGRPISVPYAARLINEAIQKLVVQYPDTTTVRKKKTINVNNPNFYYTTPLDWLEVEKVELNGTEYRHHVLDIGFVTFPETGVFTLTYKVKPEPVAESDEEPAVHDLYKGCLPYYVGGSALLAEDTNSPRGQSMLVEYTNSIQLANRKLQEPIYKGKRIRPRLWR